MSRPLAYRIRTQADVIESNAPDINSYFERRLRAFKRKMLLRAYLKHGNKVRAADALGLTYRQFRYQWDKAQQP